MNEPIRAATNVLNVHAVVGRAEIKIDVNVTVSFTEEIIIVSGGMIVIISGTAHTKKLRQYGMALYFSSRAQAFSYSALASFFSPSRCFAFPI